MDIKDIKALLSEPRVRDIPNDKLHNILVASILKIYTLAGITKTYAEQQLKNEVSLISGELANDLRKEGKFASLRAPEIGYALQCGLKGDFGDLKTFGMNYQTFYKWIGAYMSCEERVDALNAIIQEMNHKQLEVKTAPTLQEQRRMIITHINEAYQMYKNTPIQTSNLHISKIAGAYIQDLGGVKNRFLTAEGLKPAEMKLEAYFDKCAEEGKEKIL